MRSINVVLALASWLALPAAAGAQAWPDKPIKMIVTFAAGGGTDMVARVAAKQFDLPVTSQQPDAGEEHI